MAAWTVYDHPLDYPTCYVARLFYLVGDVFVPTSEILTSYKVDDIQLSLSQKGLWRFKRDELDDPNIIETWITV